MSNLYLWDIKIIDGSSGIFLFHDSRITLHRNSMQQLAGDFTYISHILINLPVDYISEKKWIKTAGRMYCLKYVRRLLWILYTFLHFLLLQTLRTLLLLSFLLLFLNNENIFKKAGRGGRHILLPHLENIVDMFGYFHANKNKE